MTAVRFYSEIIDVSPEKNPDKKVIPGYDHKRNRKEEEVCRCGSSYGSRRRPGGRSVPRAPEGIFHRPDGEESRNTPRKECKKGGELVAEVVEKRDAGAEERNASVQESGVPDSG